MRPQPHIQTARHARMFELLRQSHQSDLTCARLSDAPSRHVSHQNVEDWQRVALNSLRLEAPTPRV